LTWKESGGRQVLAPENKGFGDQLIATCVRSLDGTIRQFFMPEGFACSMNLCLGTSSDVPEQAAIKTAK
jgi:two-component sensor histidine kinase